LFSCHEDEIFEDFEKESTNVEVDQLGEKLENPFSVSNMQTALDSLKLKNSQYNNSDFEVETTHLYIRFKPKDEQELNVLESDSILVLYSFPLDREIPEGLTSYHDSRIPKDNPTFQYCAVPLSYDFPHDIKVKTLEELYLPEEDQRISARSSANLLYDLEREAFRITGNTFEAEKRPDASKRVAGVVARGKIRVWNDVIGTTSTTARTFSHYECFDCNTGQIVSCDNLGLTPITIEGEEPSTICERAVYTYFSTPRDGSFISIEGVKVRARRWFTIKSTTTNVDGSFTINHSFNGGVNYTIVWESPYWDIRDGNLTQAFYNGPSNSSAEWNLNIGGGKSMRYATIHRACYRYTYEDVDGLSRPVLRPGYKVKINYNDGEGTGVNWRQGWQQVDFGSGLLPNIKIWGKNENTGLYHATNELFSTVIHELAHTTHINEMFGNIDFGQVSEIISESWADAVEWYLTRKDYVKRGETDYDLPTNTVFRSVNSDNKQWWDVNFSHEYTPLFIDLIDDYNQATQFEPNLPTDNSKPNENITGYWMQTIEDVVLKDAYGLTSLRNELKRHKPGGVTDAQIDDYMARYFNEL